MSPTRRDFVKTASMVSAGLALTATTGCAEGAESGNGEGASESPSPKRILILGGTGFIGPHTVRYAMERGHQVSIFTRGRSDTDLPEGVERLVGDRGDDHTALEGRTWDVVLDNNCQDYRWAQTSTELLKDATDQYLFVSSISAYALEGFGWELADQVMTEPLVDEDYAESTRRKVGRTGTTLPMAS